MLREYDFFVYSAFGLHIWSNSPIPGLAQLKSGIPGPDLRIRWNSSPVQEGIVVTGEAVTAYISPFLDEFGNPALTISMEGEGDFRHIQYHDGTAFWIDRKNENVWITWPASSSINDAATYLLGPVLGYILRLRGVVCLHASAVKMADVAVVIVGSEGAGKSTTAAALVQAGHPLISDDVVALFEREGRFGVRPAYPYLALWPDSVNALFGSDDALPRFSDQWGKRRFGQEVGTLIFESRDVPLGAIYILGERRAEPAQRIEALPAQTALLALVANSYATNTLDAEARAREFEFLGRMSSLVKIRKLHPHPDRENLHQIPSWISRDLDGSPLEAKA